MIKKKVGDADQIFGSVTGADVVAAIEQQVTDALGIACQWHTWSRPGTGIPGMLSTRCGSPRMPPAAATCGRRRSTRLASCSVSHH